MVSADKSGFSQNLPHNRLNLGMESVEQTGGSSAMIFSASITKSSFSSCFRRRRMSRGNPSNIN